MVDEDFSGNAVVVDEEALLAAMGDDWETVRAIVRTYKRALVAYRMDLRRAVDARDIKAVHEVAHKLKGSLASLRAPAGRGVAEQLESAAREGRAEPLEALSDQLLLEMERVELFFEADRFIEPAEPSRT